MRRPLALALERSDGSVSVFRTRISPRHEAALNQRYAERLLKFLLWQKGGYRVTVAGDGIGGLAARRVLAATARARSTTSSWAIASTAVPWRSAPPLTTTRPRSARRAAPLGRHLEGYRIGFDLGASDRKCAAVVDGKVVFSEEVPWNPSAQADPQYHFDGIDDSLRRAAAQLPRVDAIGGSAAGVYVKNEVRVGLALPLGAARSRSTAACGGCFSNCRRPGAAFRSTW